MSVNLRTMRYFSVALRLGSISAAADALNVSASAISVAIDQIEAEFDLKLVTRQRAKGVVSTPDGLVMVRKFEALLEDFEAMLKDGVALKHSLRGDLRIGYYAPVAPAFLPDILSSLMEPEHDLTLHLEACDNNAALAGLRGGKYDAVLCVAEGVDPDFHFTPLLSAPAYCLLAEDHKLARKKALWLNDLGDEEIVILNRPLVADYYLHLLAQSERSPKIVAYCNSTEMIRSLVGVRKACALLNMRPVSDLSYAGHRLVARPIRDALPPLSLSVGYRKRGTRRVVLDFVEKCEAYFAQDHGLFLR